MPAQVPMPLSLLKSEHELPGFQVQGAAFVLAGVLCAFVAEAFEDALPVWLYELVTFCVYPALVGVGIGLATAR